jgi:hypothetical protein
MRMADRRKPSPDPQSYNPTTDYSKSKAPTFKMGSGPRMDPTYEKNTKNLPGPGVYEN